MTEHNITLAPGSTKVLHTAGKYCDRDIVVTAENGEYYDAFWDAYQENGNRTDYGYTFAGKGWNDETFKPKYNIVPTSADNIFTYTGICDLVKCLNDAGVSFDMSNWNCSLYLAQNTKYLQTLPVLDCRKTTNLNYFIFNCDVLRSIEKVILKADGSQGFTAYSFGTLPKLEEIRFEGVIGKNFEIKGSPLLSTESVDSIINALKDLTGATAQTITFHADVKANLTDTQKTAISAKNWTLG